MSGCYHGDGKCFDACCKDVAALTQKLESVQQENQRLRDFAAVGGAEIERLKALMTRCEGCASETAIGGGPPQYCYACWNMAERSHETTKLQNDLMRRTLDNIARNAKSDFVAHGAFGVSAIAMVAAKCLKDIEEGLERRSDAKPVAHVLAPEERCNSTYGAYQCSREKDHCGCHIWYPNPERIEWDSDDESPKSLKRVSEPGKCPECGEA